MEAPAIMEEVIEGDGADIIKRDGKYYIRYEYGGSTPQLLDLEVTRDEAARAQRSWDEVYKIVLSYQSRGVNGQPA
jgi:hypothetical protein